MMKHQIIKSGSSGNAVVLEDKILIDCGVPFKALRPYVQALRLVLLTHKHLDHFNPTTVRTLAAERPTLRWACGGWMVPALIKAGVAKRNIDVCTFGSFSEYTRSSIIICPEELTHDVPNCGWYISMLNGRVFYATDTATLEGVTAPEYDLYLIEANHGEQEIRERIAAKQAAGEYPHEKRAQYTHLSEEKALDFIYRNIGPTGHFVLLHQHVEKEDGDG
jgi:phosphoribosyl 1,2-cyclic phosphodiesterase